MQRIDLHWGNLTVSLPGQRWSYISTKSIVVAKRIPRRIRQRYKAARERLERYGASRWKRIQLWFMPKAIRDVKQAGHQASDRYQPKPYPGKVTLFRAISQPSGIYDDRELGWGPMALGGLEIYDTPGYHGAIVHDPRARVLAEQLKESLTRAQIEAGQGPELPLEPPSEAIEMNGSGSRVLADGDRELAP
jgi:thioesterase domain-containing protein